MFLIHTDGHSVASIKIHALPRLPEVGERIEHNRQVYKVMSITHLLAASSGEDASFHGVKALVSNA